MAEYIERESLEAHLNRRLKALRGRDGNYDHYTDGYDEAVCTVEDFPVADVAPVVHGRWKRFPDCGCTRCQLCNWSIEEYIEYSYCPNCGAKMDGGADDAVD